MTEDNCPPNCIRTYTGKFVNVLDIDIDTICIEDIAHSLAYQCRFGGHCKPFYSVADHSVNCSYLLPELEVLFHDGGEGYAVDVPTPLKKVIPNYYPIEDGLMVKIAKKFNFSYPMSPEVKAVDQQMFEWEYKQLMIRDTKTHIYISPTPDDAEKRFIARFHELNNKRKMTQQPDNSKSLLDGTSWWGLYRNNLLVPGIMFALVIIITSICAPMEWYGLSYHEPMYYIVCGFCVLMSVILLWANNRNYNKLKNGISS
jgi:hypothetical protein